MSGHRWNNRFNPPLETASVRFPRAPVELPQVRADRLTHQPPGAPNLILYNDPITRIPDISLSVLSSNVTELTVTLDVSFGYVMTGDDHYNFTFTNSNTGVSTTKRFQQDGNTYTVGEFDPGVNYYVYVTPVINGLVTPSSATQTFLSSPASAPGILQGVTLTGSGSFAVIEFESVFPTSPFPNEIAVDTNFGDEQVLVSVSAGNKRLVIGPYTNGASYQFTLTPVTKSQEGILRYGTPVGIPVGNNYFIPGPPGTLNVNSIYASNTTVYINVSFDRVVHPNPDQFRLTSYTSRLDATVATITGVSGQINDLSMSYPAFTVSSGLISVLDYITLSAGVSSSNLVADITDNNGVWYSFRVSSISSGNVYTFANTNLVKGVVLNGSSFSVNFNTVTLAQFISSVTVSSSVASSSTVGGVTTSFDPSGQLFTISPVQTQEYTTFITEAFANRIFSTAVDSATLFAGPPAAPAYSAGPEVGNQTLRWTVGRASTGPRPIYYTFVTTDTSDVVTTQLTGTISGLTNGTFYLLSVYGFANSVAGPPTDPGGKISPRFVSPTSLSVTNISDTAVLFNIGRPLGGAYGYVITASSATRTASALFLDSGANNIVANFSTGLFADIYRFDVYTQSNSTLNVPNDLSASAPGLYSLGAPFQPTNVRGVYYGYQINGLTRVNLTLTASRGLVSGFGPLVAQYNISDNFGNVYTASALPPNGDLGYTFATLSAYLSYRFTITPFGNNTTGTPVTSSIFDFNPQPPASADLFMTGNNGGVMNISFGGPAFSLGQTIDYYSISAVSPLPLGFAFGIGTTPITRINVLESPLQQPAVGVFYQFKVFTTICGITSTGFALTPQVSGGPPIAPTVSYTVGCNTITFSISVNRLLSSVVIRNFFITEYYLNVSSGILLPTGTTYTVAVTPSLTPVATYTVSGVFTTSYSLLANTGTWVETPVTTPDFNIPNNVDNNTLALNTFPNIVLLTLSQGVSTLTFPVTSFSNASLTLSYATNLTTKPITTFNNAQPLQFTWRSGTGPFTGGSYRYDFLSLGNETLRSATATPVIVNLYVGSPGTPRLITNNTTVTVTFSAAVSTAVIPEYYVVSDNYGRTVSGATTLSSFVFTNTTTGSAYSYFVTSFAQGISSAPSQLSPIVYPGRPGPPSFEASFSVLTATLSTIVFPGSDTNPYIPITDVCLNIRGQSGYQVQKTNISSSYTGNGPTYRLTNLVPGESYTFSLSAFANQVYSTIEPTCNYYVGSIPPNIPNGATITLNNTTASVSVSAAIPKSKVGGGDPNTYVFIASLLNNTVFSTTSVPYNPATATYTGVLGGLVSLTDYRFSGHTITNGLSFGSSWSDTRIFNAGGPRPITGPTYMLPAGTPATSDVSLQVTISTGAVGITGLWADTSYFISVSTGVVSLGSSEFVVLTASSYTVTVSSGNIYYASVYAVKNQVTGTILPTPGFPVLPTPPRSPVITLEPTPDINILPTTTVPAKFDWTAALTADVFYFYSINSGTFVDNKNSVEAQSNLDYGGTYSLNVYSQINGISSGTVTSASAYAFTNPPTNLAYTRRSNIITMSWESAFQPAYPSNITYTVSVTTGGSSVSALSIGGGGGGPRVTIGSNIMPPTVYSQIANALTIFRPIVVTLSGSSVTGVRYNRSYTVTSIGGVIIQGGIGAYSFGGDGPGLPTFNGTTMAFSITNPSALPTNGYTIRDLLSGTIFASNIYSNSSVLTGTLGLSYNFTVQAFNSNLYSPGTSASTGVFRLATVGVSTLSATYFGNNVTLTWTTPRQHDNSIPTTTPPYTWTIFDQSGVMVRASTMPGNLPTTQQVSELNPALGGTYTYSIITNYHGISSDATVANRVSLSTTPTTSVTQTVIGAGIRVSWLTASQSVYLPATPNVLSSVVPSGGYLLRDLCENYSGTVPVVGTSTEFYISIPSAAFGTYKYYNFGVTAVHNGIPSSTTVPGGIFLGVNPVTNPTVSLNGMIATLTWTAASINGTTVPYEIYDRNGNQFGDPSARVFQTITCNTPGVYSFTSLITETIVATAFGAGGSVAAGGAASNTYSVLPGTTVVANVGAARPGSGGENTTVYVPNPVNPQLILDAGGGGGATVSGEGFFRNGGLPFPDGGPPGQPGYGSGGDAELGMGSPAGQNGKVSMTMTTQTFRSSIQTANTSISFLVQNRTSYNFQIVSYNTTLSATVSITPFNTAVFGPTSLLTTFTALQLRNTWNSPTNTPGSYLVTNMLTGTYDIVAPGTLTTSVFSELGVAGQSYRFSILALSNSIPSSQIYSLSISLLSTPPSNFNGDYNSTAITLTASGVPGTPLETFTLTDGSGNTLVANMTQSLLSATNARVNFPLLFGIPGRIYNYNLFGITNGLSSLPVPFTLGLTIPATTTLGQNPVLESPDKLTVYQCTPPADLFRAVSTNLSSTFYNNLPQSGWIGVAMETDGGTSIAINNNINGSNIYVTTNRGIGWGSVFTLGMVGVTACNVTIAGNGTWGAVATSGGVWVSSNVSTFSPWFYVSNTAGSNIISAGFSPNGSTLVVGQSGGFLYYISNSQLYPGNPSPVFTNGQNVSRAIWRAVTWSGEGNMVFAAPSDGNAVYSINGGESWTQFTPVGGYTTVSPNSNGTYVLLGQGGYPNAFQRSIANYTWTPVFPEEPRGLPPIGSLLYRCACSYEGNIQTAIVLGVATPSAYISYDFGQNWVSDGRFNPPFTGSAISSNGFIQVVVGTDTRIQSVINVPVSTGVITSIPIGLTAFSAFGNVPQGVTGYEVIPYRKNISGQSVFVWTVPQAAPTVFPQTSGPASFTTAPYASGFSATGDYIGYFVVNNRPSPGDIVTSVVSIATGSPSPVLSGPITTNPDVIVYSLTRSGGNLFPGVYSYKFTVQSGQGTITNITVPLKPPTGLALVLQPTTIRGTWTGTEPTPNYYRIYSNGIMRPTDATGTSATIPITAAGPIVFGVEAVLNGVISSRITETISVPPTPGVENFVIAGFGNNSGTARLTWTSNENTTYTIESSINFAGGGWGVEASGITGNSAIVTLYNFTKYRITPRSQNNILGPTSDARNVLRNDGDQSFSTGGTHNVAIDTPFIITGFTLKGAGGGGGAGYFYGGLGGGQGGTLTYSGSGPTLPGGTVLTLTIGSGGGGSASAAAGGSGKASGGGSASTISLNSTNIAIAGGGGGGYSYGGDGYGSGGGVGGGGGGGSGIGGDGGFYTGGFGGGARSTNSTYNLVGTFTVTNGQQGDTSYTGGASQGKKGGGAGGGAGVFALTPGNPATQPGCGGGGGGGGSGSDNILGGIGGAGADGSVSFRYVSLQFF